MERRVKLTGASDAPWFPVMAEVMERDFDLLDDLASTWAAAHDGEPQVEDFLSLYLPDEVVGRELDPSREPIPLRTASWLMFLHGYWGGVKLGRRFRRVGAARGAEEAGLVQAKSPNESDLVPICEGVAAVHTALAGSSEGLLGYLETSLRRPAQTGALYGTAYNTGFFAPLIARPPVGALPDHLEERPGYVAASEAALLDVEYEVPTPAWLTYQKQRHASARAAAPGRWEAVVADGTDLRDLWRDAYRQGVYNWGGDTIAKWRQTTLDAFLYTSARFNMQLEAISHVVLTAVVDPDGSDLPQAARAATLFVPSWTGTAIGIGDELGKRPTLTSV